ncbi:MAG TPA: hypothetical protein VNO55_12450 [Polyangia bacterium]|nr:hypothetical protein [Polyangia bacterium]
MGRHFVTLLRRRRLLRGLLRAIILLGGSAVGGPVLHASTLVRPVVVFVDDGCATVLPRVRAELAAAGFQAIVVKTPAPSPDRLLLDQIAQIARQEHAVAAVTLLREPVDARILVFDPISQATIFQEGLSDFLSAGCTEVTAVRMVETLRATFLRVEQTGVTSSNVPSPAPPPSPARPYPGGRLKLDLSGGLGFSAGGLGITDHLLLGLRWRVHSDWWLALDGAWSPLPAHVVGPEGRATIGLLLAGFSFGRGWRTDRRISPGVAAGLWVGDVTMNGAATVGYGQQPVRLITLVPHGDLNIDVHVTARFAVILRAVAASSVPGVQIQFAGRTVATWGQPLLLASVGVATSFD